MENKKNIIEKMKELNSLMEDFLDRMEFENSDEERMDEIAKEEKEVG